MPHRYSSLTPPARSRVLVLGLLGAGCWLLMATRPPAARPARFSVPALVSADDSVAYQLRGRVFDAYTQEPIPFASLWLKRLDQGTLSDEQGYFTFPLTAAQLDSVATDSLQIRVLAFRSQNRLISFRELPADSVLQVVMARDSTVRMSAPLLVRDSRRPGTGTASATTAPGAGNTAPRRGFWQRLFGRK